MCLDRGWLAFLQIVVSIVTFISLFLYFRVLHLYTALHNNCRVLLVLIGIALILLTTTHAVSLSYCMANITFPKMGYLHEDRFIQVSWTLHETAYSATSLAMLGLVIERLVASLHSLDLVSRSSHTVYVPVAVVFSLTGSLHFGYLIHFCNIHFPTTLTVNCIELFSLLLAIFTFFWTRRKYARRRSNSLSARYQMDEVITLTRAIIPAIIFGILTKMCAMIFVWKMIMGDPIVKYYPEILSIYGLCFPWLVMLRHPRMKAHLRALLPCEKDEGNILRAEKRARKLTRKVTQDEYFEMLEKDFSKKKPSCVYDSLTIGNPSQI